MEKTDEVQRMIDEINFRKSNPKNYDEMKAEELGRELREIMKFEQESFRKIEEFEKNHKDQDLVQYAKIISRNTTGREISQLQETYLRKIDEEFLGKR